MECLKRVLQKKEIKETENRPIHRCCFVPDSIARFTNRGGVILADFIDICNRNNARIQSVIVESQPDRAIDKRVHGELQEDPEDTEELQRGDALRISAPTSSPHICSGAHCDEFKFVWGLIFISQCEETRLTPRSH